MPRYNVQRPDGWWACFSSIVDDYITDFMPEDVYEDWRRAQYGVNWQPVRQCNLMTVERAEQIISLRREYDRSLHDGID